MLLIVLSGVRMHLHALRSRRHVHPLLCIEILLLLLKLPLLLLVSLLLEEVDLRIKLRQAFVGGVAVSEGRSNYA